MTIRLFISFLTALKARVKESLEAAQALVQDLKAGRIELMSNGNPTGHSVEYSDCVARTPTGACIGRGFIFKSGTNNYGGISDGGIFAEQRLYLEKPGGRVGVALHADADKLLVNHLRHFSGIDLIGAVHIREGRLVDVDNMLYAGVVYNKDKLKPDRLLVNRYRIPPGGAQDYSLYASAVNCINIFIENSFGDIDQLVMEVNVDGARASFSVRGPFRYCVYVERSGSIRFRNTDDILTMELSINHEVLYKKVYTI